MSYLIEEQGLDGSMIDALWNVGSSTNEKRKRSEHWLFAFLKGKAYRTTEAYTNEDRCDDHIWVPNGHRRTRHTSKWFLADNIVRELFDNHRYAFEKVGTKEALVKALREWSNKPHTRIKPSEVLSK